MPCLSAQARPGPRARDTKPIGRSHCGRGRWRSPKTDPDAARLVGKNPAAVALGKLGGAKGGAARAAKLSPKKRKTIARMAAEARWKKTS